MPGVGFRALVGSPDSGLKAAGSYGGIETEVRQMGRSWEQQVPDQGCAHPTLLAGPQQPPIRAYSVHSVTAKMLPLTG